MFSNTAYSREEKDKVVFMFRNEYKPTPSRWSVNIGGAQYVHRLLGQDLQASVDFSLYQVKEEVEWEYIWSASNKLSIKHNLLQYFYSSDAADNDTHISNEISGGFKFTEYVKLSIGGIVDWNRDAGLFPSGKVNVASVGLKYLSLEMSYIYDLIPFMPENLYTAQRYIKPDNDLPPGKAHHGELNGVFEVPYSKKKNFYIKHLKFKFRGSVEKNDNFYNYRPVPIEDVLSVETIPAVYFDVNGEASLDFRIYTGKLKFAMNYTYFRFIADNNITYRPEHSAEESLTFMAGIWEFEWSNRLEGGAFIDPDSDDMLNRTVVGTLGFQIRLVETLFINFKLDNLYNSSYSLINGYPEPGLTALFGLRIII